ncbi:MAG: hypothetical protein IPP25_05325 [Saprospiraceae bacterium]|nr:hypothetical protein [Candidatus Opimibacter skivensis]
MNPASSAANAAQTLATMALYKGSLHEAEEYMRYADKNKITYEPEGLINYYSNLYTYTRLKGILPPGAVCRLLTCIRKTGSRPGQENT